MNFRLGFAFSLLIFITPPLVCAPAVPGRIADRPELLSLFERAYPDIDFSCSYDMNAGDWKISLSADGRRTELYWADGKFLPGGELASKNQYSSLLYKYDFILRDPAEFSQEDIARIRNFSSPENRTRGKGTPPFLYDFIYDCASRIAVEQHIKSVSFLGKKSNTHERIHRPLKAVETEIRAAAEKNPEVRKFIGALQSADSYSWRNISDSGNRSFHSLGLAVDVLPSGWRQKNLYWAWRRDIDPENWMLLPLERRWMPPEEVIEIFERNGFLWGGKWAIWDNMHFEYRPEIIMFSRTGPDSGGI